MNDTAKSASLDAAKDRLEASLESLNTLVTEKNNRLMATEAVSTERDKLAERVEQLEGLNAELDMAVTHQALHSDDNSLDKQAILKLKNEYEKLKSSNAVLKEELANKIRQVNALESEASTSDDLRGAACVKIDGLIAQVDRMAEQAHG